MSYIYTSYINIKNPFESADLGWTNFSAWIKELNDQYEINSIDYSTYNKLIQVAFKHKNIHDKEQGKITTPFKGMSRIDKSRELELDKQFS